MATEAVRFQNDHGLRREKRFGPVQGTIWQKETDHNRPKKPKPAGSSVDQAGNGAGYHEKLTLPTGINSPKRGG